MRRPPCFSSIVYIYAGSYLHVTFIDFPSYELRYVTMTVTCNPPESLVSSTCHLFRGVLQSDVVSMPLSPASIQASRLAAGFDDAFIFATRSEVYKVYCTTKKRLQPNDGQEATPSKRSTSGTNAFTSIVSSAISGDYVVPRPFSSLETVRDAVHSAHQTEVQSVVADPVRLATIDSFGRCIVTFRNEKPLQTNKTPTKTLNSLILAPPSLSNGMAGWADVALFPGDGTTAATTRQFYKDVNLYDADVLVRTLHTLQSPAAMGFTSTSSASILVAEGNDIALYDGRAGEAGGRMGRKQISTNGILSADVSPDNNIAAVAGGDRIVYVFDTRMLNVRDRWPSCLKYDCAGVLFSQEMNGMVYVCSVDNEVACGAWNTQVSRDLDFPGTQSKSLMISGANTKSARRAFGFRADIRITGMARRTNNGEEIGVVTESGAFYLLRRTLE